MPASMDPLCRLQLQKIRRISRYRRRNGRSIESITFGLRFDELRTLDSALVDVDHPQEPGAENTPTKSQPPLRYPCTMKDTHNPKRNAKGMLSLLSEALIIADDTNGPIKADVLPTCDACKNPYVPLRL